MCEYSAYSSQQADSKVKFAAWPTSWRPLGAGRLSLKGPKVNSRIWLRAVDDNTINIELCIVIIITALNCKVLGIPIYCLTVTLTDVCLYSSFNT